MPANTRSLGPLRSMCSLSSSIKKSGIGTSRRLWFLVLPQTGAPLRDAGEHQVVGPLALDVLLELVDQEERDRDLAALVVLGAAPDRRTVAGCRRTPGRWAPCARCAP